MNRIAQVHGLGEHALRVVACVIGMFTVVDMMQRTRAWLTDDGQQILMRWETIAVLLFGLAAAASGNVNVALVTTVAFVLFARRAVLDYEDVLRIYFSPPVVNALRDVFYPSSS